MESPLTEKPAAEELPVSSGASIILNARYLPPPQDKDGKIWVRTSALIQSSAQELYELWRNVEAAPTWQEQIVSVVRTGPKTSVWTMRSDDKTIEWSSEILADEPGCV